MEIEIIVPYPMITAKAAVWPEAKEWYKASQEAIRYAVQNSPQREDLKNWLEKRIHLEIEVEFHLNPRRSSQSDLDSLFSELLNPIVEGACGPRPKGQPIPQTKDALFWKASLSKRTDEAEKTIIKIKPLEESISIRLSGVPKLPQG